MSKPKMALLCQGDRGELEEVPVPKMRDLHSRHRLTERGSNKGSFQAGSQDPVEKKRMPPSWRGEVRVTVCHHYRNGQVHVDS